MSNSRSIYIDNLLLSLQESSKTQLSKHGEPVEVSETVSFVAFVYEKIRNSVEFNEEHLVRKIAITRILKRRFSIKPTGEGEGENLIRELLWGKYISAEVGTTIQVVLVEEIIQKYLLLQKNIIKEGQVKNNANTYEFIIQLMSCEIEEALYPVESQRKSAYLYFLYQEQKNRIQINGVDNDQKDSFFYAACESAFLKNDVIFIRYHLFVLQYGTLLKLDSESFDTVSKSFKEIFSNIESIIKNPFSEKLVRYIKKQLPPFYILYNLIDDNPEKIATILKNEEELSLLVSKECSFQYQNTSKKLQAAGIRSIIYIFLTKMIFVLLLEIPLSKYFYHELHLLSLSINTLFPPILMGIIITFVGTPSNKNTQKIYARVQDIIAYDPEIDNRPTFTINNKKRLKRPIMYAIFTIIYSILFWLIFSGIFFALDYLHFNIISKGIFIFFLTVVTFFGYRIRQIAKEFEMEAGKSIISPIVEIIFLPILYVGKIFSRELSKINLFMFVFDVFIETPLKVILDVIEEWFKFTRKQKEEII